VKLLFRARQELINIILTALPPAPGFDAHFDSRLAWPDGVAGSECAQQTIDLADQIQRHQFPIFTRANLLTADRRHLDEIQSQLESWMAQNPFHRGTNWASALEVAFRALSRIWVDYFVGSKLRAEFRAGWLHMMYLHGCHLANNLSFYFSPNKHLVGEAVALHALGLFFSGYPKAARWECPGAPG